MRRGGHTGGGSGRDHHQHPHRRCTRVRTRQARTSTAAAPHLRQDLDGNRAAHEAGTGNHAHTTVIGHSYGSTVIGDATKSHTSYDPHGGALPVDDIIAAGSPGMRVGHASDLGIGSDHDD
ncbi:alpha/beta hydrolase [Streptomyces hygroscopicus]|uniref:alpha/beta hydrolase n=1 Tax=Streptomyces hygroscopicus TaxID=1912 RepID=UPI0033C15A5A